MKISSAFPSNYLKATDFEGGDQTLTIKGVQIENVGGQGKKEEKPVVYFREVDKGLILNKTNANTIEKLLKSDDTDEWLGSQITIGESEIEFQGEMMMGIRVRQRTKPAGGNVNNNGGSSATNASDVLKSIKADAWKRFTAKHISTPKDEQMTKLIDLIAKNFPGNTPNTLGIHQWQQLIKDDFEIDAPPFGDESEFKDDDIPF